MLIFTITNSWFDLYNKSGDKKVKGQLRCQIEFFNRIDESVLEVIEGVSQANLEAPTPSVLNRGILHFNILEAKDISMFPSICPKVVCFINKREQFTTSTKKNTIKPGWNETREVFVENFESDVVELQVIDTKNSNILGSIEFLATEVREMGVCFLFASVSV